MRFVSVYITFKDVKEAKNIARTLVEDRLLACANVYQHVSSFYRWKGAVQSDTESALIGKTRESNQKKIIKRVKELHSYQVPCIVFWPVKAGDKDFLDWIGKETI